jgi:type IV pilus assembly protein PilA
MSEHTKQERPFYKRRRYFVDARLQLALALPLLAVLVVVALAYVAAVYLLPGRIVLQTLTIEETRALFLRANLVYYAIGAALLVAVSIVVSHRIAGPARVIEHSVRALGGGDYGQRLSLRPSDSLRALADAVNELRQHLRDQDEQRAQLLRQLGERLEAEDLTAARALLAELSLAQESSPRSGVSAARTGRKADGFTIIELMLVVGILGILATLAIPTMLRMQLRAKAAEGRTNIAAIVKAEEAYFAEFNVYASALPPQPIAVGPQRMPWPLTPSDAHGFNQLGFAPEGQLYFQYGVTATLTALTIAARSDIDGDGAFNTWGYVKPFVNTSAGVAGPFGTCASSGVLDPVSGAPNRLHLIGPCDAQSGSSAY